MFDDLHINNLMDSVNNFALIARAERVYGPYYNGNQNRKIVIIVDEDGSRKTMSWPKYLLEKHLGYSLDPEDTVDHIDRNHNNDNIDNLRIVPRVQHSTDDTRRVKLVKFKCSLCNKEFERSPRLVRDKSKKGRSGVFCSRHCAGQYARKLQLGQIEKFPVQPYIESEYYRNIKNIESVAKYFSLKYI